MAVTLDTYAPFDAGAGANSMEATWRAMMRHLLSSGPIRGEDLEFEVFADSTGMQVKVRTGEAWMRGHWGEGTSTKTLPIAANSSGSTRIDRVVLRLDATNNLIELDVVGGTPGSGVPTALTQNASIWEESLATVSVPNADASIDAAQVTDDRTWSTAKIEQKVLAGRIVTTAGNIHSNLTTTETTITKLNITGVRVDLNRVYEFYLNLHGNLSVAGDSFTVRVRKTTALSGTVIAEWPWLCASSGLDDAKSFSQPWKATANTASESFFVSVQRVLGSGNIDINGDRHTAFWIKNGGAESGVWSEVA